MKLKRIIALCLALAIIIAAGISLLPAQVQAASGNTEEFAGGTGTADDPYLISTKYHLDNVRNYLSSSFKLINDIEFTEADFSEDSDFYNYGVCWKPIGDSTNKFTGNFDGGNFEIRNLQIHKKNSDYVGLFGYIYNGGVSNLRLVNVDIEGKNYVGSVCGYLHSASVSNSRNVKTAYINSCYSSGNIVGYGTYAGGLCGYMDGISYHLGAPGGSTSRYADAKVEKSINETNVTGNTYSGGIVGYASSDGCTISSCSNNGAITATTAAGGILGYSNGQTGSGWSQSGLSGPVTMRYYFEYVILENCVNKGNISANKCGGIIGDAYYTTYGSNGTYNGAINSYNIGTLTGDTVGGIIPCKFTGEIKNCFYLDTSASAYSTSYGVSVPASDLKLIDTFAAWDFDSIWTMAGDKSYKYPELQCFVLSGDLAITGNAAYKETVTPNTSGLNRLPSSYECTWYIDGEEVFTGDEYTIQASDAGKELTVKLVSSDSMCAGSVTSPAYVVATCESAHTPAAAVKENETAPSYVAPGSYDSVIYCSVCGAEISRQQMSVAQLILEVPTISVADGVITLGGNINVVDRVGVFYIGENTVNAPVTSAGWNTLVSYGKQFTNINGKNGYIIYAVGSQPTLTMGGNYAIFLKYTVPGIEGERTVWATATVDGDAYFAPEIAIDEATGKLSVTTHTADTVNRIGVFYLGSDESFKGQTNPNWSKLVAAGKKFVAMNGTNGYKTYGPSAVLPELTLGGNYAVYVKYTTVDGAAKTVWFTPEVEGEAYHAPVVTVDENGQIGVDVHEADTFLRVCLFYIGDHVPQKNPGLYSGWIELIKKGKEFKAINGSEGYKIHKDLNNLPQLDDPSNYAILVKYNGADGTLRTAYLIP